MDQVTQAKIMVSAIICTYNQEQTIAQTIESVLNQQCNFSVEIIIGEDCGTDNTRSICLEYQQKYPEKIKLILFEKNGGMVHNWLSCIKEAKGKYIGTCAGDDYWHNIHKLQLQVDYMEAHSDCGVLHTDYDELNSITGMLKSSVRENRNDIIPQGYTQHEIFTDKLKIIAPTACIRKSVFDAYVPVDKYLELNFSIEDWPTWIILSKYAEINYLPVSTVTYRSGHESISNSSSYEKTIKRFASEKIMYKFLCDLFPGDLHYVEKDYDIYINKVLLNIAYNNQDFKTAEKIAKELKSLGFMSIKSKCAQNVLFFYLFCITKKIYRKR